MSNAHPCSLDFPVPLGLWPSEEKKSKFRRLEFPVMYSGCPLVAVSNSVDFLRLSLLSLWETCSSGIAMEAHPAIYMLLHPGTQRMWTHRNLQVGSGHSHSVSTFLASWHL